MKPWPFPAPSKLAGATRKGLLRAASKLSERRGMRFVQHPSNNKVLGAPSGWDQSAIECGALPVTVCDWAGKPAMVSYWEIDDEDRAAIARGAKIRLWVLGEAHPPVALDVAKP